MKLGVKEFRERFSALAEGDEPVIVTKNGRIVGRYLPASRTPGAVDWNAIYAARDAMQSDWKARTPDWRERLESIGLDEQGEPIE